MDRRFRLQAVERLRGTTLDAAARELGRARQLLGAGQARLAALREELVACSPPATATPSQLIGAAARRDLLREQAGQAEAELTALHEQVVTATARWHSARADLRAVEALHERHRQALAEDDARREQLALDELAVVAWRRRATPGPHPGGGDAA